MKYCHSHSANYFLRYFKLTNFPKTLKSFAQGGSPHPRHGIGFASKTSTFAMEVCWRGRRNYQLTTDRADSVPQPCEQLSPAKLV